MTGPPDGHGRPPTTAGTGDGIGTAADEGARDAGHNPSLNKLSRTLKRGATISASMLFVTQLISLAQTVVVARLLSPAEIGAFTLGTIFANFMIVMADGGMRAALIHRETDVEDAANTAFWASLVTGVLMSTAALAASPLLALFFGDHLVALIAAATSGTLLVHSLLNVPEALMQRRFNFKRRLIVDPLTAGSFAVVTVTLCALGLGVWGMVIGLYASQIATLVAAWGLAGWRPGKGRFSYRLWREMARYAFPMIVQNLAKDAREIAQQSIVGRSLDIATAGQYRYGRRIGILPGQAIIQVASYVLFPAFSRISSDAVRFRRGFVRALRLLWTATVPLGAFLVAAGGPAIVVLLGPQWAPAGVFVAAMAGFGPGTALNAIGVESIKGAGASKRLHWATAVSLVLGIGGLIALLPLGLLGVGLAVSIEGMMGGILTVALARPLVKVLWSELVRVLLPPLVAGVAAGAATWALEHLVLQSDTRPLVLGLLYLLADAVLFAAVYLAVLAVLAPATVAELKGLLVKLRRRGGSGADAPVDDEGPDDTRHGEDHLFDVPTIVLALGDHATQRLASQGRRGRHSRPDAPHEATTGLSPAVSEALTAALDRAARSGRTGRARHALAEPPAGPPESPPVGTPVPQGPVAGHPTVALTTVRRGRD
ncbi:oligosaccharide flippase family protein [Actinomycetospora lutea]|uniref:oligosaccharide flippase family protein n=1 Tax=Actinomycetospora lutea TaxID=663604 RepID=UPI00236556E9|nr:oligosaccharide flippase family protein [Actinomycetospora lutea]MDD7940810.1 oligosaccharide flippase family protein [Actinomycetospora lutea]